MSQAIVGRTLLAGGYRNDVWKVRASRRWVIEKNYAADDAEPNPMYPNLPDHEAAALQLLAGSGSAPRLVSVGSGGPTCRAQVVYEYVPGAPWRRGVTEVAELLLRVHAVAAPTQFRRLCSSAAEARSHADAMVGDVPAAAAAALTAVRPRRPAADPITLPALVHTDCGPGYDVFAFIDEMAALGFNGVNVSANGPGLRDLCGSADAHFAEVRRAVCDAKMLLELDTSDTRFDNMHHMLHVAAACGADTLRTYTKYTGSLSEVIAWTVRDLRAIAPVAEQLGVTVVLENHEDFTGPVLADILGQVDHPRIRALYDYGNSQMVGEDPLDALDAMAPFIARVHMKDHVLLATAHGPIVQGVPFGSGRLPIAEITDRLYAAGVRRFCFENVWSYTAPLKCSVDDLPVTPCFAWDDTQRYLRGGELDSSTAVLLERAAFDDGLAALRAMLSVGQYQIEPSTSSGR